MLNPVEIHAVSFAVFKQIPTLKYQTCVALKVRGLCLLPLEARVWAVKSSLCKSWSRLGLQTQESLSQGPQH